MLREYCIVRARKHNLTIRSYRIFLARIFFEIILLYFTPKVFIYVCISCILGPRKQLYVYFLEARRVLCIFSSSQTWI